MKRALGILLASLALVAVVAAQVGAAPVAGSAKKKKTYCQKFAKAVKGTVKAKSKGFYVIRRSNGYEVDICQDKPKFTGDFSLEPKDKIGNLNVVKNSCGTFSLHGPGHNDEIYVFNFANFLKGGTPQAAVYTVGSNTASSGVLLSSHLSANCVNAFGERVDGSPQVTVYGTTTFGYTATIHPPVSTTMTDAELRGVKISGSGASATATWNDTGVPQSYTYSKP